MSLYSLFDPEQLIAAFGLVGIILIIFAESGLFFGFFLPGDSLLFTAGFLASQGYFSIWILAFGTFFAAVLGDSVGYWFGKKTGPKLFTKEDSFLFKKEYILRAEEFYEKHGKKTIILARFIPIVRTFAPIVAGIGNMNYKVFLKYNIVGGALWAIGLTFLGYFLGRIIPGVDKYIIPIVILILLTSFLPPIIHLLNRRNTLNK